MKYLSEKVACKIQSSPHCFPSFLNVGLVRLGCLENSSTSKRCTLYITSIFNYTHRSIGLLPATHHYQKTEVFILFSLIGLQSVICFFFLISCCICFILFFLIMYTVGNLSWCELEIKSRFYCRLSWSVLDKPQEEKYQNHKTMLITPVCITFPGNLWSLLYL